mgnify:CR=1 FL=1
MTADPTSFVHESTMDSPLCCFCNSWVQIAIAIAIAIVIAIVIAIDIQIDNDFDIDFRFADFDSGRKLNVVNLPNHRRKNYEKRDNRLAGVTRIKSKWCELALESHPWNGRYSG